MRKSRKRAAAMVLAMGMAATGSMTGYAAPEAAVGEVVESVNAGNNKADTKTELVGSIKATQLKVTLPLKAAFDIDPGKIGDVSAIGTKAVNVAMGLQSANYKITNESAVPVWVYISGISAGSSITGGLGASAKTPGLINDTGALESADRNLMIAIKDKAKFTDASKVPTTSTVNTKDGFWLTTASVTGKNYYLDDDGTGSTAKKGKLDAAGTTGGTSSIDLEVFALTKKGWTAEDKFAITPTFTVSVVEPS
ncbi:MAG: hypothetical protein KHZ58_18685 [Hungatella hathewayi]|nr:hypothetical protein [Hungatella hathewayi]